MSIELKLDYLYKGNNNNKMTNCRCNLKGILRELV